jgi:hypothetical protein
MSRHVVAVRPAPSRRTATAVAVLGALAVTACGSKTPVALSAKHSPTPAVHTPTAVPTPTPTPAPTPTPTPPPPVPGATYTAPAIVQVENLNDARPQSGLQSADVVYEYSAEGGISRFSVVYFSTPKGQVGPIRSARLISPPLVSIYGGTLVYSGSSNYVSNRMNSEHTARFDETSAGHDMFRVGTRYVPHNLYTDGGRVDDMVHRSNQRPVTYQLWGRAITAVGQAPVGGFTVPVSPGERPSYTWRADLGGWTRAEPDTGTFIDANTGQPVVAATVVVMQVPARLNPDDIENGCCTAGWEYTMTGSGPDQVFTNGAEVDGTWTQGPTGPPQFTLPSGAGAPIAPGLVWIAVVPTGQRATAR